MSLDLRQAGSPTNYLGIRINDDERAILEAAARVYNTSFTHIIRQCINGPVLERLQADAPELFEDEDPRPITGYRFDERDDAEASD